MYHEIRNSIDMISSRAIWPRKPMIEGRTADAVNLLKQGRTGSPPRHGHGHGHGGRKNVGVAGREEIDSAVLWRVWRERREYLLPLALSLIGVAATVIAAVAGWYAGTP